MDPIELQRLAAQAGITGGEDPTDGFNTTSYADENGGVPSSGRGFTDEDLMAHFAPDATSGADPSASGDIEHPAYGSSPAAPLPPIPTELKSGEKVKAGVSASASGYSEGKAKQIAKGTLSTNLQRDIEAAKAEGAQKEAERGGRLTSAAGSSGGEETYVDPKTGLTLTRQVGGSGEMGAAHGEAIAANNSNTAMGHQKAILANLQQTFDTQTENIINQGANEANTTKAKYVAARADFAAARVDPNKLWHDMSGGQQFGMLVAAFAHDFLGAKGIKTSAMDTLNKAIDRNIDAQVRNIQTKREAAEGFKTLWEMQVADSHSMLEARTRMKGFMLDTFKTATEAYMSQFDAQLATAKGRAAIAQLDAALQKNLNDVSQHVDQNTATRVQQLIQKYGDDTRAAMESAKIAVERERNKIEAAKAGLNQDPNIANLVYDNSKSGGGYASGIFKPGISQAMKDEFLKKQAGTNHLTDLLSEYRDMYTEYGNQGILANTRLASDKDARLRAIAAEILEARALNKTGKAASDKERAIIETGSPFAVWGLIRNNSRVLADTERREFQDTNRLRQEVAFDLPADSSYRKFQSGMNGDARTEIKDLTAIGNGTDNEKSSGQIAVDDANKQLEKHNAKERFSGTVYESLQNDHDRFIEMHPEQFPTTRVTHRQGTEMEVEDQRDLRPMGFEKGLTDLKDAAISAKKSGDTAAFNDAVGRLRAAMNPQLNGDNNLISDYAAMVLSDLNESVSAPGTVESVGGPAGNVSNVEIDPRTTLPPIPTKKKK